MTGSYVAPDERITDCLLRAHLAGAFVAERGRQAAQLHLQECKLVNVLPSSVIGAERIVTNLYARSVFFVADAERSLRYYTEDLGFSLDWDSRDGVFQVSLFGFELILNQVGDLTRTRAGHGRVFIGLEDDQGEPLRKHIAGKGIQTLRVEWGRPTLVIRDVDANELFFWVPHDDFSNLGKPPIDSTAITEPTK